MTDHRRVGLQGQVDPVVPLDLRDRGAQHVRQRHRPAQSAPGVDPGQDDQRLGVAAHPGGEVVELEQVLERVRVLLGALELVDERQLTREQHVVAAGDVDEHLGDRGAQRSLLLGDAHGRGVHVSKGARELTDLVGPAVRNLGQADAGPLTGRGHPLDHQRQLVAHLPGDRGERAQRAGDGAREHQSEQHEQGDEQTATGEHTVGADAGRGRRVAGQLAGVDGDRARKVLQGTDPIVGDVAPVGGVELDPATVAGRQHRLLEVTEGRAPGHRLEQRRVEGGGLGPGGVEPVGRDRLVLQSGGLGQGRT